MPVYSPADWSAFLRPAAAVAGLAFLWLLESRTPAVAKPPALHHSSKFRHAARNYTLAAVNGLTILTLAGSVVVATTEFAASRNIGLLPALPVSDFTQTLAAVILLDLWTWGWHLTCHHIPALWRFHRVHHSDHAMDVSSSARFHPGELACSTIARIPVILLLGLNTQQLLIFETLLLAVSQMHHSAVNASYLDRWLGWLLVTPGIHRVHHSRNRRETNSNYAAIISGWDRLFKTHCPQSASPGMPPGLQELDAEKFQTVAGLLTTPLLSLPYSPTHPASGLQTSAHHPPSPGNQTEPACEP
jgi:sterol desaturase/sphingolipid hydroxylase (fatty acid hydroxylase superfamily)